jgi:hypothetical protein
MNEDVEITGEQLPNSNVPKQLQPYQYKKGQSGNPSGRPKGISLKEYAKMKLQSMTDEEREEFLNGLNKNTVWEMAEGKAKQDMGLTDPNGKDIATPILDVLFNNRNQTNIGTPQEN